MDNKEMWLKAKKNALRKHESGERLTLEETAYAIWNPEKDAKPMTCMGILKIEQKALAKLKNKLKSSKIFSLDDVFEPKYRERGQSAFAAEAHE